MSRADARPRHERDVSRRTAQGFVGGPGGARGGGPGAGGGGGQSPGHESEVSVSWLAEQVRAGKIRWVLTDGRGGGSGSDGRTGSTTVMAAVAQTCTPVNTTAAGSTTDSTSGLYDCAGRAEALASAAS